jgi:hypothetical protein
MARGIVVAQFHDTTGSGNDSQVNYGPANVGAGYQITRVRAAGVVQWNAQDTIITVGTAGFFEWPLVMAVQIGATGFTPTQIGNSTDEEAGNNFIDVLHLPGSRSLNNTTSSAAMNAYYASSQAYDSNRLTQISTGLDGRDVYLSIGYNYSYTMANWRNFGSLHVIFQ